MYKCLTCNNTYASKAIVLQHRKKGHLVNGLEPKMMCPVCPKVFYRSITLQQHMKKHNGNNNYATRKKLNYHYGQVDLDLFFVFQETLHR